MSRTCTLVTCFCIVFLIPTIALSIASIYIGVANMDTSCDTGGNNTMKLSTWLFVNSGTALGTTTIYIILLLLFLNREQYKYLIIFLIIYVFNWIFVVSWNVVGAIELFKDSIDCRNQAESLWVMVLVSLIFQWIGLAQIVCLRRCNLSNMLEMTEHIGEMNEQRPLTV
ncbi:hypothetical protein QKU48_gp1052 [Fadolivirus algeromassiliense]|jgi:hypothetical protein|uniref:Uncharacterized protein n=1 Tax=Fadolivirus FV1/VV64 TaxID=3070911 RepID=A0A7D3UTS0_9VIRU|nr:hypothetical protein QKU48_gp1052 [Fadolivirus algeromassiliense]QKF94510.1 hypothetical protein Fadolivirus_1_1052 [Fadolivirus FV1/VV64]